MSPCASQPSTRRPLPAALGDVPCCSSSPRARPPLPAAVRGSDVKADSFQTLCCAGPAGPERRLHKHPAVTCRPPTRAHRELPKPSPVHTASSQTRQARALGSAQCFPLWRRTRFGKPPRRPASPSRPRRPHCAGKGLHTRLREPPREPRVQPQAEAGQGRRALLGSLPGRRSRPTWRRPRGQGATPRADLGLGVSGRRSPVSRAGGGRARAIPLSAVALQAGTPPLARRKPALAPGRPEPLAVSVGVTE